VKNTSMAHLLFVNPGAFVRALCALASTTATVGLHQQSGHKHKIIQHCCTHLQWLLDVLNSYH